MRAGNPDGKMVLLVDEYDKPLVGHLGKDDVNEIRDALKEFYSVIKTCEGMQRFPAAKCSGYRRAMFCVIHKI